MTYARRWWGRRTDRQRAWLRWGGPLFGLAVAVAVVWLYHRAHGVASLNEARALLLRVGVVAGLAGVIMITGARRWRLQGLGLLAFLLGVAGLFVRVIGRYGPQPPSENERDLIQALLDVGSVALFLGLLLWLVARRLGKGGSDAPSEDLAAASVYEGVERRLNRHDRRANPPPPRPK